MAPAASAPSAQVNTASGGWPSIWNICAISMMPAPKIATPARIGRMREGRMLALEQHAGDAVGAEQTAEDHGEAQQLRHLAPMRRDKAHGAEADEHGTEDAEGGGEVELARMAGDVAADGGFAVGVDPAGLPPAHEVAVEALGVA